jgi:hypothetical protein
MKTKLQRSRELREAGKGLLEAKRIVEDQDLNREILEAQNVDDLKAVLWSMVARR